MDIAPAKRRYKVPWTLKRLLCRLRCLLWLIFLVLQDLRRLSAGSIDCPFGLSRLIGIIVIQKLRSDKVRTLFVRITNTRARGKCNTKRLHDDSHTAGIANMAYSDRI